MRVSFHEELDQLSAAVQEEGTLVLRSLRAAMNALVQHDVELANEVISFDDEIDAKYSEIERGIESLLARQRRSPSISGSSSRCCTSTCTSSGWATTA